MFIATFCQFFLSIVCMLAFLKAYFPIQQTDIRIIDPPTKIHDYNVTVSEIYTPQIDRLVFIIIDALREDFLVQMPYSSNENSCVMTVKVEAPTVTLPRIKALTTGGVPQFIDIILNLGATTKCDDSFLHRAVEANKRIVFYGDDTWIKLFPEVFARKEGTTSFYVNDFHEVDDNVTRHIPDELTKTDWDILIVHYLGLDHIGHVQGPFSHLIQPKLQEMDDVIRMINEGAKSWDKRTLILVTGDHGMKDSGGHGGTTHAETHVPLIAFNSPCRDRVTISQTDIPTTLSALFAVQLPGSSIGKIVTGMFNDFNSHDIERLTYIMFYNSVVLRRDSKKCDHAKNRYFDSLTNNRSKIDIILEYEECLNKISSDLINAAVDQNIILLILSIVLSVFNLVVIIVNYVVKPNFRNVLIGSFLLICVYFSQHDLIFTALVSSTIALTIINAKKLTYKSLNKFYVIPIFLHIVLLQSSSFIEEEHQIWYYYTGTASLLLAYVQKTEINSLLALSIIIMLRFIRTLNSTGDQWASYPDLADWFLSEENFIHLQIFYAISLILTFICISSTFKTDFTQSTLICITLASIFVYKIHYFHIVKAAQAIWILILINAVYRWIKFDTIIITWMLIIGLLVRPYNAILLPACVLSSYVYTKYIKRLDVLSMLHLWLGYTLHFCQGHSNSIASVDLAPGYIGLNSYIPTLVFLFTIFHIYAFPVLTFLLLAKKYLHHTHEILTLNIISRLSVLITIFTIMFIQRNHLFIWSVFAPKLLIESVHTSVLFLLCSIFMLINCTKIK